MHGLDEVSVSFPLPWEVDHEVFMHTVPLAGCWLVCDQVRRTSSYSCHGATQQHSHHIPHRRPCFSEAQNVHLHFNSSLVRRLVSGQARSVAAGPSHVSQLCSSLLSRKDHYHVSPAARRFCLLLSCSICTRLLVM